MSKIKELVDKLKQEENKGDEKLRSKIQNLESQLKEKVAAAKNERIRIEFEDKQRTTEIKGLNNTIKNLA